MTTRSVNDLDANRYTDYVAVTNPAVMVNGDTIFTLNGDIQIMNLFSECITANGATASTLQYSVTPTIGSATTISGASSTLASAVPGTLVVLDGTALSTAPIVATTGVSLSTTARGILAMSGVIKIVIGTGSTTGTWKHYIRYKALESGAYVSN
jgi:hypothetical protein